MPVKGFLALIVLELWAVIVVLIIIAEAVS
jgi:hypothetical protein